MPITATVIEDSVSPNGIRLTTLLLRYPRFIHAELMTHRVFSRNASSSRAIPIKRLIEDLKREPAMPVYWGGHQAGMQAGAELEGKRLDACRDVWLTAMNDAVYHANTLHGLGLHKQIANRVLEPFAHINVVVTATEWDNFFELRDHPDAQPEIHALAIAMREAMNGSTPKALRMGGWHLPFVTPNDWAQIDLMVGIPPVSVMLKVSTARCARTSYLTHDMKEPDLAKDIALYDKLVGSRPLHASPAEHQATPDQLVPGGPAVPGVSRDIPMKWERADEHGNFVGWRQHRKILEKDIWG